MHPATRLVKALLDGAKANRTSPEAKTAMQALEIFTERTYTPGIELLLTATTWYGPRVLFQKNFSQKHIMELAMKISAPRETRYEILLLYMHAFNSPVIRPRETLYIVRRALERNIKDLLDVIFHHTQGIDVNSTVSFEDNLTALMFLADRAEIHEAMDYTLVDFLVVQGAYLEFTDPNNDTALHLVSLKVETAIR